MVDRNGPIGLLDSGIGGLTVVKELKKVLPQERLIYFGDTLHLPYGPRPAEEVKYFVFKIINYLVEEHKVKVVVIACNTASSVALDQAQSRFDIPIFGTIDPAVRKALQVTDTRRIGIIGTEGTIESKAYQQALTAYSDQIRLFTKACPEFVTMVEKGRVKGLEVNQLVDYYLADMKNEVDTLILGCTHFPYLSPIISKVMGQEVFLVDPAVELADRIAKEMRRLNLAVSKNKTAGRNGLQLIVSDGSRVSKKIWQTGFNGEEIRKKDNLWIENNIFA